MRDRHLPRRRRRRLALLDADPSLLRGGSRSCSPRSVTSRFRSRRSPRRADVARRLRRCCGHKRSPDEWSDIRGLNFPYSGILLRSCELPSEADLVAFVGWDRFAPPILRTDPSRPASCLAPRKRCAMARFSIMFSWRFAPSSPHCKNNSLLNHPKSPLEIPPSHPS